MQLNGERKRGSQNNDGLMMWAMMLNYLDWGIGDPLCQIEKASGGGQYSTKNDDDDDYDDVIKKLIKGQKEY